MQKIKPFYLSFSFRAGTLIFFIFCTTLLTLRILAYSQSVNTADADIRLILNAHIEEINEGMERYGPEYLKDLVETIVEDTHDKHLYLVMKQDSTLVGNLPQWPDIQPKPSGFREVMIPNPESDGTPPLHLLVDIIRYPQKVTLLVGYDLERVDILRQALLKGLLENIVLAFAVSLAASLLLVWLLNRFFRRFNLACERVMEGNIAHRIKTYGTGDEFDRLAENVNRMLDWNGALIAMVKDSSNAIAHDMRTPLSRLRLELRALSDRVKLDTETRKLIIEQVECVDRLVEMFDNILNIAKAESRSSTELFEPVDTCRLVRDVLEFYQPIIEKKHLSLHVNIPETPLVLRGDKQLLGQAIVNLIDNACKFTPKGGRIEACLERNGSQILLTIADSGVGIPAELLQKVKERFFRMDSSRHTAGYGLGLSIVNAVAVLHQGDLVLEDNSPGLRAVLTLRSVIDAPVIAGNQPA